MDASAWIALAGLAVVVVAQGGAMLFAMGGLFARVKALEDKPQETDCKAELAVVNTRLGSLETAVTEVAHDIKNMMTGKIIPARRASS
jgi:hypothetical protein